MNALECTELMKQLVTFFVMLFCMFLILDMDGNDQ